MSKRYGIRWTENDNRELTRSVKNFNAKVKRLEEKYKDRSDVVIPEKVSVKELRDLVGTRRDLNRELKSLQRFSQRGSEELVEAPKVEDNTFLTKWQKTEMNRRAGVINRTRARRKEQIEDIEMTSGGKALGYTRGQFGMGKADELSLKPTKAFTKKMDKGDIKKKFKSLRKHSQSDYFNKADRRLVDNYVKALKETYGTDAVSDIVEAIEKMDFPEFYKKFKAEPDLFEFTYPPDDADVDEYLNKIRSTWVSKKSSTRKKK